MFNTEFIDRLSLFLERFVPLIFSACAIAFLILFGDDVCTAIANKSLSVSNLYGAVLSWASIQVGFAFGVYGYVLGKTQGFVEEIRETIALARLLKYVKRANYGGFALTFFSLPLAVISPAPTHSNTTQYYIIVVWFALFVWTFFAFLRIAFNFGHITAVRDRPRFTGA